MGRKDDFVNIPMEKKDYLINFDYELIKIGENRAEERCKRRIAELEATVEQMKCCGNCKYHIATMCGLNNDTEYGSHCCGNWQPDGLTKEEREAK